MHQNVDEQIEVEVVFLKNKVIPRSFSWRGVVYRIQKLGMVHHDFAGREKIYFFSVSDGANFFRLALLTGSLQWRLEEIYSD